LSYIYFLLRRPPITSLYPYTTLFRSWKMTHNEEMFERTVEPILDVNEKPKPSQWFFLSSQHLFAMFGATVLVPFLTGLPVSAALIASVIGQLLFIVFTNVIIHSYLFTV